MADNDPEDSKGPGDLLRLAGITEARGMKFRSGAG